MDDEDLRTIWCGNLNEKVTEDILYELFMQGGPVQKVSIPKDRDGKQKNFGFVTFKHECSVPYALDLFEGTTLFKRTLNMKSRNNSLENSYYQQQQDLQLQQQQQIQQQMQQQIQQQMQQQIQQQMQQQGNMFDSRQITVQNDLQLGTQVLMGSYMPMQYASNDMFMMPGSMAYPSQGQGSFYGSQKNMSNYSRNSSRQNRNHPYQDRDQYNDRHNRHESFDRDHKSYKHSSHRSNRHDNRRKYR